MALGLAVILIAPLVIGGGYGWFILKQPRIGLLILVAAVIAFALLGMAARMSGTEIYVGFGLAWISIGTAVAAWARVAGTALAWIAMLMGSMIGAGFGWQWGQQHSGGEWGGLFGGILGEPIGASVFGLLVFAMWRLGRR